MSAPKVSVQFTSIVDLWAFRKDIHLNAFYLNIAERTITFVYPFEEIDWAIKKYNGQVLSERQNASSF